MCLNVLGDARLYELLLECDRDLAAIARDSGCPCGGVLHSASYERKPRGWVGEQPEGYDRRHSFCCVPETHDATVGALSRAEGLSRGGGGVGDRAPARRERPSRGRAPPPDRRQSPHAGTVADVVARDLHGHGVLAGRAGAVGAAGVGGRVAGVAARALCGGRRPHAALAAARLHQAGHDGRRGAQIDARLTPAEDASFSDSASSRRRSPTRTGRRSRARRGR